MEGGGWYGFAAPLSNAHPRLTGTLLFRPLHLVAHLPKLGHWDSKDLTSLVGWRPSPETAARSEGIGLSRVAGDWCGAPYTYARGRASATTAQCVGLMTAFVIVGSRGTLQS